MKRILLLCLLVGGLKAVEGAQSGAIKVQPQDFVRMAGRIVYHEAPGEPSVKKPYDDRMHRYLSNGEIDNMKLFTRSQDALPLRANTTVVEIKFH